LKKARTSVSWFCLLSLPHLLPSKGYVSQIGRVNARFRLTAAGAEVAKVTALQQFLRGFIDSHQHLKSGSSAGPVSIALPQSPTSAGDAGHKGEESYETAHQLKQQRTMLRDQFQLSDNDEPQDHNLGCVDRGAGGALLSWLQPLATRPPPLPPVSVPHLAFPLPHLACQDGLSETSKVEPVVRAFRTILSSPPLHCAFRLEHFRPIRQQPDKDSHQSDALTSQPLKWHNQRLRVVRVDIHNLITAVVDNASRFSLSTRQSQLKFAASWLS
jgi:hypothetical protein